MVADEADIEGRIIDAALTLAAEREWRTLALADIADAADLPLATVAAGYRDKNAVLAALARRADRAVLEGATRDDREEPARDRLLDAIMRRFDALRPYRDGLRAIHRHPLSAVCAWGILPRSMAAMLEAAGIPDDGARGAVRAAGLAAIYLSTFRVWLEDESEDWGTTTAHLARRLERADKLIAACQRRCRPRR